jgi:TatD DNase family protein
MTKPSSLSPLIDIGLNLASGRFQRDWTGVVAQAQAVGVEKFILTGTSLSISEEVARRAAKLGPNTAYFTAGVHPHRAEEWDAKTAPRLRELLALRAAVAVGETGLDYNRDIAPRSLQRKVFEHQVQLACELQMPLFLHERDAAADLLAILDAHKAQLPPCVVHCFTGGAAQALAYVERGFYLGVTGWVGQSSRNAELLTAMPVIPANRLMLETDAPYLTPPGYRPAQPGRNEPAAMVLVAELAAKARGVPVSQVRADAYTATKEFFRLP